MKIKKGNLIQMAIDGEFDVIAHGCNCFCKQKAGIATSFVKQFGTNTFPFEEPEYEGSYSKMGNIDYKTMIVGMNYELTVVNCYTQYRYGNPKHETFVSASALDLCLRKLSNAFSGSCIGIPAIGTGLGGLKLIDFLNIAEQATKNANVTVVIKDDKVWQDVIEYGFDDLMVEDK